MKQMICSVCSYVYDETKGIPESEIAPGTKWEELPDDWKCPWCGAHKEAFREKSETPEASPKNPLKKPVLDSELSAMEMSILCSNLARSCEKQYLPKQAEAFLILSDFFKATVEPEPAENSENLLKLLEQDLSAGYPYAHEIASQNRDRGALRALAWSEKVTRMLQSLLSRYESEGEQMLTHTGVFLCSVCGFLYVGDQAPEHCPVCKVPAWKFEKIERRTSL